MVKFGAEKSQPAVKQKIDTRMKWGLKNGSVLSCAMRNEALPPSSSNETKQNKKLPKNATKSGNIHPIPFAYFPMSLYPSSHSTRQARNYEEVGFGHVSKCNEEKIHKRTAGHFFKHEKGEHTHTKRVISLRFFPRS